MAKQLFNNSYEQSRESRIEQSRGGESGLKKIGKWSSKVYQFLRRINDQTYANLVFKNSSDIFLVFSPHYKNKKKYLKKTQHMLVC